jgi:hypothetical protein
LQKRSKFCKNVTKIDMTKIKGLRSGDHNSVDFKFFGQSRRVLILAKTWQNGWEERKEGSGVHGKEMIAHEQEQHDR